MGLVKGSFGLAPFTVVPILILFLVLLVLVIAAFEPAPTRLSRTLFLLLAFLVTLFLLGKGGNEGQGVSSSIAARQW